MTAEKLIDIATDYIADKAINAMEAKLDDPELGAQMLDECTIMQILLDHLIEKAEEEDNREYRVKAYFTEVYPPRSYKRKVTTNLTEALRLLKKAKEYYSSYKYLDRVVLESRKVGEWKEER